MFLGGFYTPIVDNKAPYVANVSCREAVLRNMDWLKSAHRGGCAYNNFYAIFRAMALSTGAKHNELNWYAFDRHWEKYFDEDRAVIHYWKNPMNMYTEEITNLLTKLVQ